MGRRKIAIEPIPHERNRSVTFLKRKHGLFKKAYELGVLCSVDVAVIIFEEKPGHHLKLYQYCSSDIHDIVQRHVRHDGEKDTRGPADFSGVPSTKFEEFGEGDEEEVEDEDEDVRRGVKRPNDGHVKSEDISLDVDLSYPQSHIFEAPSSIRGINPSITIPSDRRSHHQHSPAMPNKRVRTGVVLVVAVQGVVIPTSPLPQISRSVERKPLTTTFSLVQHPRKRIIQSRVSMLPIRPEINN
ncbi:SRF-like protein [Gymnopus androsaceus JB14]|uniref:SRF-like protein n=1 Tax=Gymnopus androsaceus JB14 TaxID=1447944 RepID=A0A6A4I692_9AGAR|nr:SRF-like protein [Gymnopus androsaceus JB14]